MAASHFDDRFSRAEQDEWLNAGAGRTGLPKNEVEAKSSRKNPRIEQVLEAPYWPESRALLNRYVTHCIFSFEETERKWWSMTAPTSERVVRINIGQQEVLSFYPWDDADSYIVIAQIDPAGTEKTGLGDIRFEPSRYALGKQTIAAAADRAALNRSLDDPRVLRASRSLSLALMRASLNHYPQHHSSHLVAEVFKGAASFEASPPRG
jgi:hypothetical protein